MAAVSLLNVAVRNNPAPFTSPYEFEITFECLEKLDKDLEWKLTYVGSATSLVSQSYTPSGLHTDLSSQFRV
jgi:histone chaperone ASF1